MKNFLASAILIFGSIFQSVSQPLTRTVLFLGNSYTSTNNIPQITADIASNMGDNLVFDDYTPGGYKLSQHYTDPVSLAKIQAGPWDFIVLQEQSQIPSSSGFTFVGNVSNMVQYIKNNTTCTLPMFYMTWGRKNGDALNCPNHPQVCTYLGMDAATRTAYMSMAQISDAEVTPVGAVWRYVRSNYPAINLYQPDDSHPTAEGSYLAACCFYTTLFRKDPSNITYNYSINPSDASSIRSAVKAVVYDSLSTWFINKYNPVSNFSLTVGTGTLPNTIGLINHSQYAQSYVWNYGDGNTSSTPTFSTSHTYTANGTYTISLTASSCFLGQVHSSVSQKVISFCAHTPTVLPTQVLVCPGPPVVLWTQQYDSYQWLEDGVPIPGATSYSCLGNVGSEYSVLATLNGCSELSEKRLIDTYIGLPGSPDPCAPLSLPVISGQTPGIITIYPNPVNDILTISVPEELKGKPFQIVDGYGKLIIQDQFSETEITRNIQGLPSGIYVIRTYENSFVKFVKR